MYLVPIINLFHTLKLGPQSKESANFFNKVWDQDCRFVPQVSQLTQRQSTCGERATWRREGEFALQPPPLMVYFAHRRITVVRKRERERERERTITIPILSQSLPNVSAVTKCGHPARRHGSEIQKQIK